MSSEIDCKVALVETIISEWEFKVITSEEFYANKIYLASDNPSRHQGFTQKELVEQEARVTISALKTPLAELKKNAKNIVPQGETIGDFSLFELTATEVAKKDGILICFVLPLDSFELQVARIKFEGVSVNLLPKRNEYFGKSLNYKIKREGYEIYEEGANRFEVIPTGKFVNDINFKVTHIYK